MQYLVIQVNVDTLSMNSARDRKKEKARGTERKKRTDLRKYWSLETAILFKKAHAFYSSSLQVFQKMVAYTFKKERKVRIILLKMLK